MSSVNNKLGFSLLVVSVFLWKWNFGYVWILPCLVGLALLLLPEKGKYVSPSNKIVIITGEFNAILIMLFSVMKIYIIVILFLDI
jgi:hypothetical protein